MNKTIKINGIEYTDFFTPTGYSVSYKKIKGQNVGYMLDGSYTDEVLAVKAVVTCICMPTNEQKLSQLLTVLANEYLDVYFYDPQKGVYRTAQMMPSDPSQIYKGKGADLLDYWTGTVIQFTER